MLALAWPAYWIGLLPVVAVESFIGVRILKLSWKKALQVTAVGNMLSTFVGIPVVWVGLVVVEFSLGALAPYLDKSIWQYALYPFYAPWLGPTNDHWVIYGAFVVLAVPFCLVSIWLESRVAIRMLPTHPLIFVRRWVRIANAVSYGLIVAFALLYPLTAKLYAT